MVVTNHGCRCQHDRISSRVGLQAPHDLKDHSIFPLDSLAVYILVRPTLILSSSIGTMNIPLFVPSCKIFPRNLPYHFVIFVFGAVIQVFFLSFNISAYLISGSFRHSISQAPLQWVRAMTNLNYSPCSCPI